MPFREFVGCRMRIERAKAHRDAFAKAWNGLLEDEPYEPGLNIDDDGTGTLWVNPRYEELPSVLALELGELLYQLRAALDGAIYGAAIRETGEDPPPDCHRLEFPICESAEAFRQVRWKLGPLEEKRCAIVESVQPYNAVEDLQPELEVFSMHRALAILNDWARKDRHRTLHLVGSWVSGADPLFSVPEPGSLSQLFVNADGLLEYESQVAEFKIDGFVPGMNVRASPNLMIDVAVGDGPGPAADNDTLGNRVRAMLVTVGTVVKGIEDSFHHEGTVGTRLEPRPPDGRTSGGPSG